MNSPQNSNKLDLNLSSSFYFLFNFFLLYKYTTNMILIILKLPNLIFNHFQTIPTHSIHSCSHLVKQTKLLDPFDLVINTILNFINLIYKALHN